MQRRIYSIGIINVSNTSKNTSFKGNLDSDEVLSMDEILEWLYSVHEDINDKLVVFFHYNYQTEKLTDFDWILTYSGLFECEKHLLPKREKQVQFH